MRYEFPHNITVDEVRTAVANHNERTGVQAFIEVNKDGYTLFNYVISFDGSFPEPTTGDVALDREFSILRECRGLTFCTQTGRIAARKYHKFFNVNQKPESQADVVDFSRPHNRFEKLDGSMITPMFLGDIEDIDPDKLLWCTKMGVTDVALPVAEWVSREENKHYARWSANVIYSGYTPIFEWCSRQQKIVIDYPVDRLVLTAIRNNATGAYQTYEQMQGAARSSIDVVRVLDGPVGNIHDFIEEVRDIEDIEGYVVRFDNGHMVKLKAALYCAIHGTKDLLQHEKDVVALIIEDKLDDVKPFMDQIDRDIVTRYHADFVAGVEATAAKLKAIVDEHKAAGATPKVFATEVVPTLTLTAQERGIILSMFSGGHDGAQTVMHVLSRNYSTGPKVDGVRHLFGNLIWRDYRDYVVELDAD